MKQAQGSLSSSRLRIARPVDPASDQEPTLIQPRPHIVSAGTIGAQVTLNGLGPAPVALQLQGPVVVPLPQPATAVSSAPPPEVVRSGPLTRVFALAMLAAVVGGVGYVAHSAYRASTDAFIAPMILSPDSDVVVDHKAKLTELEIERERAACDERGVDAELERLDKGMARLHELEGMATNALDWTRQLTKHQAYAGSTELGVLGGQAATLNGMIAKQRETTERARKNLDAGIITSAEYEKEEQALNQMMLGLLENGRTQVQARLSMTELQLAQASLAGKDGAAPMPEVVAAEDLLVRVQLEAFRLEAEQHAKRAERAAIEERIAKLDDLQAQLKSRPLFQAIEKHLDVAFVPYTQIDHIGKGASVLDCALGFFACRPVGTVAEVVPGEVILPDPWGTPARGQYVVLDLKDHQAAQSKSLRARVEAPSPLRKISGLFGIRGSAQSS